MATGNDWRRLGLRWAGPEDWKLGRNFDCFLPQLGVHWSWSFDVLCLLVIVLELLVDVFFQSFWVSDVVRRRRRDEWQTRNAARDPVRVDQFSPFVCVAHDGLIGCSLPPVSSQRIYIYILLGQQHTCHPGSPSFVSPFLALSPHLPSRPSLSSHAARLVGPHVFAGLNVGRRMEIVKFLQASQSRRVLVLRLGLLGCFNGVRLGVIEVC